MKREPVRAVRLKQLPHRHRAALLRALIRQRPVRSIQRDELMALLRAEMTAQFPESSRLAGMNLPNGGTIFADLASRTT